MVTQVWKKFKHLFEKMLHLSVVGCLIVLFEQLFEYLPQGCTAGDMSALTVTSFGSTTSGISSVNQGFLMTQHANPSGRLTRRGRLARTIVVLSLAVVMVAGFAATSGANVAGSTSAASSEPSYSVVVVAPGETLWSVAAAYATGDVQGLINEIREVNNLKGYDRQAGQRLRVPLNQ